MALPPRPLLPRGRRTPLCGGPVAFTMCRVFLAGPDGTVETFMPLAGVTDWAAKEGAPVTDRVAACLVEISTPRAPYAGLDTDRPSVVGIVNVTPDSFSDEGAHQTADAAVAHAIALSEAGADMLDIGGESTRPGAAPISIDQELDRVMR